MSGKWRFAPQINPALQSMWITQTFSNMPLSQPPSPCSFRERVFPGSLSPAEHPSWTSFPGTNSLISLTLTQHHPSQRAPGTFLHPALDCLTLNTHPHFLPLNLFPSPYPDPNTSQVSLQTFSSQQLTKTCRHTYPLSWLCQGTHTHTCGYMIMLTCMFTLSQETRGGCWSRESLDKSRSPIRKRMVLGSTELVVESTAWAVTLRKSPL